MDSNNGTVNIMFVDDEPMVLSSLRRSLDSMNLHWNMSFAGSGAKALDMMNATRCDVVVTDLKMPGTDGLALLEAVRQNTPSLIRFFLSSYTRRTFVFDMMAVAHGVFVKPYSPNALQSAVSRWMALRETIPAGKIRDTVFGANALPVFPETHRCASKMREAGSFKPEDIRGLVMGDPGLAARCLRLAGGVAQELDHVLHDVDEAISFLQDDGFSKLTDPDNLEIMPPELEQIIREKSYTRSVPDGMMETPNMNQAQAKLAATVKLLRDAGKLVLLVADPHGCSKLFSDCAQNPGQLGEREKSVFGVNHIEVSACLCAMWGLCDEIIEAVKLI